MDVTSFIEKLTAQGCEVELRGDDRSTVVVVDGVEVGAVRDDLVYLYK